MSRLLAYLGRFVAIILGFFCASLAASAFLHLLVLGGVDWRGDEVGAVVAGSMFLSIPLVGLFVAYMAFLPAIPVVIAAEALGLRGWLFHALAGGTVGLAVALLFLGRAADGADTGLILALLASGIVAGTAYWLVAGRRSGLVLDRVVSGPGPSGS